MNLFDAAQRLGQTRKTRPSAHDGARLSRWLFTLVERGRPPLDSAWDLAERYRRDPRYGDTRQRVRALVRAEIGKTFSAGVVTGLGGSLALPVAVPAAAAASWLLQARLIAAMAYLMGHPRNDPWVRAAVLMTLDDAQQATPMAQGAGHLGDWAARRLAGYAAPQALRLLERQVGRRLLSRQFGRNAARLVPLIGAVVAGSLDAREAYATARRAWRLFSVHARNLHHG